MDVKNKKKQKRKLKKRIDYQQNIYIKCRFKRLNRSLRIIRAMNSTKNVLF